MKIFFTLLFFLAIFTGIHPFGRTFYSYSQGGTWTQKASVFVSGRGGVVGFSIGTKGYYGCGYQFASGIYFTDFWEWDQPTNVWTQKANFSGAARGDASGFSIGTKGYIGTGFIGGFAQSTQDFYEWDHATNTWTQKANFPGIGRCFSVGFSIGNKGYIGIGYDVVFGNPNGNPHNDFWEWDQTSNSWTQKAPFAGGVRGEAIGISIGNKGYIATGYDVNGNPTNDLWEWNQSSNAWSQKATLPGAARGYGGGFTIGTDGYMGTGYDVNGNLLQDFWKWDQLTNTWAQMTNYPHLTCDIDHATFSIGCKGYFGCGADDPYSPNTYYHDFWEYAPPGVPVAVVSGNTSICAGQSSTLNVSGGTSYSWSTGATSATVVVTPGITTNYMVVVSDANGCSDVVSVTVPVKNCCSATPVVSSDPSATVCVGQNVFISASGGITYSWNTGATAAYISVTPGVTTTYSVTVTDAAGCTGTDTLTVPVDPNCNATGLSQINTDALQVNIWPNPSDGMFNV
ncbi:MAG: hypothetical protein EPN85_04570 [Bacteroidetes bacterium]|nr:MAG: hypothetical protein EPN85_04570 [Bacteroidota bacterium]